MQKNPFFIYCFLIFIFLLNPIHAIENIILLGPPGSGKGTFSQIAIKRGSFLHICPGDMIRKEISDQTAFGLEVKEKVALGEYLPEETVFKMIKLKLEKCLEENLSFIIDGFPRSDSSYLLLKNFLIDHKIDKKEVIAVILNAPDETLRTRILNRIVCPGCFHVYNNIFFPPQEAGICDFCHNLLTKRSNDTKEVICKRLIEYHESVSPFISQITKDFLTVQLSSLEEINHFLSQIIQH